ncbi:E3 ubiquitin-protein ligase TRAIP [Anthophora retusa]
MNVICSICNDQLMQSDDIFYTRCGHVFHYHCLTPWLERSPSCPQCREKVTQSRIHRLFFTFSSNEINESQGSSLQEKVDSLKFKLLLKEKDIQHYSSKCVTLEKQNAGLKQEVRKVEGELNQKIAAIYALKEQISYFQEQSSHCNNLKREIAQLKSKIEDLRPIEVLLHAPISDVSKMVGKNKDPETLTTYISVMKKELIERFSKCKQLRITVKKLQEELSKSNAKLDALLSKQMNFEEKVVFSESKSMALQKRVDELEEILDIDEKCGSISKVRKTGSKNVSNESAEDETLGKDDQDASSESPILSETTERKIELSAHSIGCVKEEVHNSQIESNINDSDIDFVNCSFSKNSSGASKRHNQSEDDIIISNVNDNSKLSNYTIPKKKRKNNTKRKTSDAKNKQDNNVIDLT